MTVDDEASRDKRSSVNKRSRPEPEPETKPRGESVNGKRQSRRKAAAVAQAMLEPTSSKSNELETIEMKHENIMSDTAREEKRTSRRKPLLSDVESKSDDAAATATATASSSSKGVDENRGSTQHANSQSESKVVSNGGAVPKKRGRKPIAKSSTNQPNELRSQQTTQNGNCLTFFYLIIILSNKID